MVVVVLQIVMLVFASVESINPWIPYIRQICGFIYLSYVPGIIILKIFKTEMPHPMLTHLYAIGFSVASTMGIAYLVNQLFPFLGIFRPISPTNLIITMNAFISVLCIICFLRNKESICHPQNHKPIENLKVKLFLLLMPLITIIGVYLVNYRSNNIILMVLIIAISFILLLVSFSKYIPYTLYPLTIWTIALSLIWHTTLISPYLLVNDVLGEYVAAGLTSNQGLWITNEAGAYNSVLSVALLPSVYSNVCNLDLVWYFKIISPLLYSFTSVCAYFIFLRVLKKPKAAFLTAVLFVSMLPFFVQIPLISKQSICELFLGLFLLASTIKQSESPLFRKTSITVFALCIIVSHYGTSYILLFGLLFLAVVRFLLDHGNTMIDKIDLRKRRVNNLSYCKNFGLNLNLSIFIVVLFIVFTIAWYVFSVKPVIFNVVVNIGESIANTIMFDFLNTEGSRGMYMITREESSLVRFITKIVYLFTQLLIFIGVSYTILSNQRQKSNVDYVVLSSYFLLVLVAAIAVSGFAVMDPRRLYHLSLFLLAPFCILGWIYIGMKANEAFKLSMTRQKLLQIFSLILISFLLLNTGFISEITADKPTSFALSQETILNNNDLQNKAFLYGSIISEYDINGGKWFSQHRDNADIYVDDSVTNHPSLVAYGNVEQWKIEIFDKNTKNIGQNYAMLQYVNIVEGISSSWDNSLQKRESYSFGEVSNLFYKTNKLYSNWGCDIMLGGASNVEP